VRSQLLIVFKPSTMGLWVRHPVLSHKCGNVPRR
jgi:hypothetical protein